MNTDEQNEWANTLRNKYGIAEPVIDSMDDSDPWAEALEEMCDRLGIDDNHRVN